MEEDCIPALRCNGCGRMVCKGEKFLSDCVYCANEEYKEEEQ